MHKVVIIDDEDIIVRGLREVMPWEDYDCKIVGTANNGSDAIELIHHEKPDIVFTDICMPQGDGLSLIAAVRSEYPEMQITILSGYSEFEYAKRAIALGVCRYVLKPSKFDELEEALRAMVNKLNEGKPAAQEDPAAEGKDEEGAETAQNFIIKNALKYIEEHYAEKLTLSDVADKVYVSQWHLSKLIAKNTNQSFSDLLNGVRIERAKKLLCNPALRIWEISEAVGFADVTHFSRIFKKHEGMSANEYRNKQHVK
ncbi:MAG: response regulator [Oscillospiraceae bacterium]|nr:response regulator [Oscillospiraceae bacterium]